MRRFLPGILLLMLAGSVAAAPQVTIKGHSVLRLLGIQRTAEGTFLHGELSDRDLLAGIPNRTVEVAFTEGERRRTVRVTTDSEGRFKVQLGPRSESFRVEARFAGDLNYASETAPTETLDVSKQTLELELSSQRELDASQPRQLLGLRAQADGKPASVSLALRTDRGHQLGQLRTDAAGQAPLRIETSRLGQPGPLALLVHFAGDERLNPSSRRFDLTLVTPVQLSLRAEAASIDSDDELGLAGEIRDLAGPLSGATVHLDVLGRQTASAVSDGSGRFRFRLDAADFPVGRLDLVARHLPAVSWRKPASSPPVEVQVRPPRPIPFRLYLLPPLITSVLLLALLAIRRGGGLLRWLRNLRLPPEPTPVALDETALAPVQSGLRPSRSTGGLRALVRQADDLRGTVWDPTDRTGVGEAEVVLLTDQGETRTVQTSSAGAFSLTSIPLGTHQVTVRRSGYVSERFAIQIPHRGQLHEVRIDLVQVRVRILELYRISALPLLPHRELWARWTPRELARHVGSRQGRRHLTLEQLTRLLEQAYWSGSPPGEELIRQARGIAAEVGR